MLIGLTLLCQPAQAISMLIPGVTASANVASNPNLNIANTVNGQGLSGNTPALTGIHARGSITNIWGSASGNPTGTVTFDFQTTYALDGFSFWNLNAGNVNGINGVTISTSTDGTNYNPLQNITGILLPFNATTGEGNFVIGSNSTITPVQQYTSAITNARYVQFDVTSNYGGPTFGFAEAQFSAAPAVPVPLETDALPVVVSTAFFAGGMWIKRRRKIKIDQ